MKKMRLYTTTSPTANRSKLREGEWRATCREWPSLSAPCSPTPKHSHTYSSISMIQDASISCSRHLDWLDPATGKHAVLNSNCSGWIWVVFLTQLGTI